MMARSHWKSSLRIVTIWPTVATRSRVSGTRSAADSGHGGEQVTHLGRQLIGRERFGEKVLHSRLAEPLHDFDVAIPGHGDDGNIRLDLPELRRRFSTAEPGHRQVQ